ncbi:DUF2007 domain-containing protein [Chromohalobacter sp. TMW 2.2308]|uniref:putative signal transducing protein n=1 Tax=Chromohalobacter TaxID=42054 RepID=UPI001FFD472C|nr:MULTISPECIES: DUF2007 domain-containing protein [Chromohalobacter]MCK2042386.1 DUF2007 domain-containing protein [Chromohalobacter moromii]MCT8515095.1 DUF2007 domain-containing protein [Chromohalobacter sp. TMW 2.2271]
MTLERVRVFRHPNALLVNHVHNVLASAGLVPVLRNMTLGGGAGELPPGECEPEVWVPVGHRQRAEALVDEALNGPAEGCPNWCCPACGEWLDGVFDTCWQCNGERPR